MLLLQLSLSDEMQRPLLTVSRRISAVLGIVNIARETVLGIHRFSPRGTLQ